MSQLFYVLQMSDPNPIRCPYCVQSDCFKIMTVGGRGVWFKCDRCGHTAIPKDLTFQCCCLGCFTVSHSSTVTN
jgi:hypothetical protein